MVGRVEGSGSHVLEHGLLELFFVELNTRLVLASLTG